MLNEGERDRFAVKGRLSPARALVVENPLTLALAVEASHFALSPLMSELSYLKCLMPVPITVTCNRESMAGMWRMLLRFHRFMTAENWPRNAECS